MRFSWAKLLAVSCLLLLACNRQVVAVSPKSPQAPASSDMTGCDLWFSLASTSGQMENQDTDNKTLAHFCECRDSMAGEQAQELDRDDDHQRQLSHVAVGQLDCGSDGDHADEMLETFETFLRQAEARQLELKVDYLTIRINTQTNTTSSGGPQRSRRLRASQLAVSLDNLQQLDSSLNLVQLDRLQSLALSVEPVQESGPNSKPPPLDTRQLMSVAMLNQLTALQRLEISLDHHQQVSVPLILDLSSQSRQLKWLSVSSRKRPIEFAMGATGALDTKAALASLLQLEHLSLEWNQLEQFHLFAHFPRNQPNLFSLNLANNKLKSLRRDLLCCENQHEATRDEFSSLSQLDLSSNQLEAIEEQEAQTIRTKMPNLANLYLQHNKIKHLHLGALLGAQPPRTAADQVNPVQSSREAFTSQLEFIDLSHNQLTSLLTIQLEGGLRTRLRAINLAHNFLRRPISLIGPRLMQVLEVNSTGELVSLDRLYELSEAGLASSLCDYLSSAIGRTEPQNGAPTLVELSLGHNRLERLERRHFQSSSCSSLEILHLNDNQISVIEQEAFKQMDSLQELDLSGNSLIELPAELFVGLRELRLLNLAHNSLAGRLDLMGAFGSASSQPEHLRELRLAHNQIEQLELWPASGSNRTAGQRLEILDLAHNQLTFSSDSSLRSLVMIMGKNQLTEVRLDGNKLAAFDWIQMLEQGGHQVVGSEADSKPSGQDKTRLKSRKQSPVKVSPRDGATSKSKVTSRKATLATKTDRKRSARQISTPTESNHDLDGAKSTTGSALVLSNNRLTSFGRRQRRAEVPPNGNNNNNSNPCSHLFMRSLQALLLDNNSIREIASSSFRCLEALEVLDLQANQLRVVDELAFSRLDQLRQLNLANNYLIRVAPRHFESNRILNRLDLSRNQLTGFEWPRAENGGSSGSSLEWLDLSGNQALRLNGAELWPLLAAHESAAPTDETIDSGGLRRLDLSGISSVWSPRQSLREFGKTSDRLSLEELELGDINQLDWTFMELVLGRVARLKRLRVSVKVAGGDQLSQVEEIARMFIKLRSSQLDSLSELVLSNGQLTNQMLSQAIESSSEEHKKSSNQMKLNVLDLSRNALTKWPLEADRGGQLLARERLVELNLSQNRLADQLIGPSSSANETLRGFGLINLEKLNLSLNSLTGLLAYRMDAEESQLKLVQLMPRLRQLDLAHNKLSWLPLGFFAGLNQLERLDLSHNQLVWRRAHLSLLMKSSISLRHLDLSFNVELLREEFETRRGSSSEAHRTETLLEPEEDLVIRSERTSGAISCGSLGTPLFGYPSDQLEHPDETSGDGQDVRMRCAAYLARLRTIKLDGCCKSTVKPGARERAVEPSSKLATVSLTQSDLSSLESVAELLDAATRTGNELNLAVIHLDASRNKLSKLNGDSLCRSQPQLRSLELQDQIEGLTEFDLASLRLCRQLAYLDLSHNRLSSIRADTSTRATSNLIALDLAHNNLSHLLWLALLVEASPNLRQLDLRSNRLREVSSTEWILERVKLSRVPLEVSLDLQSRDLRNRFTARHRLEVTPDDSGLRIQPDDMANGLAKAADSRLVIDMNLAEANNSNRRLTYEVDASISHLFLFCTMRRQLAHRLCLNSTTNSTKAMPLNSCLSFRPPKGPTCLTKLEVGAKLNRSTEQLASGSLHFAAETSDETISNRSDQSDWLLRLIEAIRRNWIKLKQFDLGAHLATMSQIKEDAVLFYVAGGDRKSGPFPVYTLSLIKLGLATAAFCVVLLAIAMFLLLNSSSSSLRTITKSSGDSRETDSSGDSSQREDPTPSCSSAGSASTGRPRHLLRSAPSHKLSNHSPGGSAYLDDSSATMTTTTTTGGGGQTGAATSSHSSRPPARSSASLEAPDTKRALPFRELDETLNAGTSLRVASNARHQQQQQQQLYCSTPSSSLAPSSVETGETMQAVDSLQGSTGGSTLCYQSPGGMARDQLAASQLTLPVHSVDQYAMQQTIYGQLTAAPPVATVMRMVKSSTFNNANALSRAAPDKPPMGLDGVAQSMGRNSRQEDAAQAAGHYNLQVPQSISLMSMAGHEVAHPTGHAPGDPLHELDPATLSLLSLNSQLSSQAVRERPADTGLCHYHSKFLQDNNSHKQQPGYTLLLDQTLLEQEDEQNYGAESSTSLMPVWFQNEMEYPAAPPPDS